jgi:predicted enzyme related to lactoylglutathione lyase
LGSPIRKVDTVGLPARDGQRLYRFYVETLGLRPDEKAENEFWIGETCFSIWEPERVGLPFEPHKSGVALLRVDDVAAARSEFEAKGVEFVGETFDTGVCHMATFKDADGNHLVLHNRYAP